MAWKPSLDAEKSLLQMPDARVGSRGKWLKIILSALGAIILCVVVGAAFVLFKNFDENKHVAEVSALIEGAAGFYRMAHGRDGLVYIFAENERDASWARQVLTRQKMHNSARVSTVKEEEARLGRLLFEKYPKLAFYRLKLADPMKPTLLLSRERNQLGEKERGDVNASLMRWMPYAEKVVDVLWSDSLLDNSAKDGLDRMHLAYDRRDSENSVTYRVQGNLSDSELATLQGFIDDFYRDFGARYVSFSVVLKEDWLKGKSFKYGGSGYVKMTPQHWFFPFDY
jgi:type III secretion system PrgH/EprH family protein